MSRLPRVSGKKTARALECAGFELRSIKGDHARYRHPVSRRTAIVPLWDRVLSIGTLASILRQAGLTNDEFRDLL